LLAAATLSACGAPQAGQDDLAELTPAPTAGPDVPTAVLRFELCGVDGALMPGRLTFVGPDGPGAEVFPGTQALPHDLAVRKDVVYSLSGRGAITVPAGRYEIWASRGIEYGIDRIDMTMEAGWEYGWQALLPHEVDTTGWVSGDYHLHTLTYSGHGDANLEERIISLVGEGVEFAVATDHNHNTDYGPTVAALGAGRHLDHVTGNEVSTPIGHFNAFPLEPDRPVPDPDATDADDLFALIHAETNRYGLRPVVQLNHPRWGSIDYFGLTELDPVTATSASLACSYQFDTLEVFNGNDGWGYYDPETAGVPTGRTAHSVLQDWFNLLNRGVRCAAVGNSDSHTVHYEFAGYPRNYVRSAGRASIVADVVEGNRAGATFTTIGPFVHFTVQGEEMGATVEARGGSVAVQVAVQAASWIDCDRVKVVVDGVVERVLDVPNSRDPRRFEAAFEVPFERDGWICVLVEGDDPMAPVVQSPARPVRPLAVANPVFVDADGNGRWSAPYESAVRAVLAAEEPDDVAPLVGADDRGLDLAVLAAADARSPLAAALVQRGLASESRRARLAAARAAERTADASLLDPLRAAWTARGEDSYLGLALLRARRACGDPDLERDLTAWLAGDPERAERFDFEVAGVLEGSFVTDWAVAGYDPSPEAGTVLASSGGPAPEDGAWTAAEASESGYLDLRQIDPSACENAIAYAQTWVRAPAAGDYGYTLGTDDGCRAWVGGRLLAESGARRGASPLQHIGQVRLEEGWNRVVIAVENGSGGFGLYFRILDDAVTASARPR